MKILKYIVVLLITSVLLFIFLRSIFPYYRVGSDSMEPTLSTGDLIIVNKYYYKHNEIKRGDIVLFKPIEGLFEKGILCHRIIALEGDTVVISNKKILVNGQGIGFTDLDYGKDSIRQVPQGYVFQKGDNSTTRSFGEVSKDKIMGKVIFNVIKMKKF